MKALRRSAIDWWLFGALVPILAAGLVTMYSFTGDNSFAARQAIWIGVGLAVFFLVSSFDVRFLRSTWVSVTLFSLSGSLLSLLFVLGRISHGAESWLNLGLFSFQPSDLAKVSLLVILAKYFSRRHIEIANARHIAVSGAYTFAFFILVLVQPDLGSAFIIFLIWLGMIMVSGVSKRHLFAIVALGLISISVMWFFGLKEYQKDRIRSFVDPSSGILTTGYNAYQSTIAVGSGGLFGKGLGYGTQSRLKFLPEYQADFIFAAFAEEWGFLGVIILLTLYGFIVWRIVARSMRGATNFEILFGTGVAVYFIVQIVLNVGMNMKLLPVTGTPLPLMSYGGTHIVSEFLLLGLLSAMGRYARPAHKDAAKNEFVGPR